ncbi:MAG: serine/threonine-protein kinase [Vulcanimicrobiota bacterium]
MQPSAPETVCGYKVLEELGRGAMGTVYLAVQENLGRKLAIKVMSKDYAHDAEFIARFKREGMIAARLRHPNVVQVYDAAIHDGIPYIAMEYLGSRTMKCLMSDSGRVPVAEAVRLTEQLLDALDHAHRQGIIHRDIKPANIMITDAGDAALTDFSISYLASAGALTQTGTALGTPEYMAPEQLDGRHGEGSDIYAVAIILYEMLTGISPFRADSISAVMKKQLFSVPEAPCTLDFEIPEGISNVVMRGLSKEPAARYQHALEMKQALREAMAGTGKVSSAETIAAAPLHTADSAPAADGPPTVKAPPSPPSPAPAPPPPPVFLPEAAPAAPAAPDWSGVQHVEAATMVGRNWDLKSITEETHTGLSPALKAIPAGDETLKNPVVERPASPETAPAPARTEDTPPSKSSAPLAIGVVGLIAAVGAMAAFSRKPGALPQTPQPSPTLEVSTPVAPQTAAPPPPPAEGKVLLKQLPAQARVLVDEQTTPTEVGDGGFVTLPLGSHQLKVSAPEHKPRTIPITVSGSETGEVAAALEWSVGNVSVKVEPAGARLEMDGKKVKAGTLTGLTPGKHVFKASLADYETEKRGLFVEAGKTKSLEISLKEVYVPPPAPVPAPYIPPAYNPPPAPPPPPPGIYR